MVRLCQLLLLLSRHRHGLALDELRSELAISRSTFFRDLKVLQDAGVPIDQEQGRYRFLNASELPPLGLTAEQLAALHLARRQLVPLGGSVLLNELDRFLGSLGLTSKPQPQQTSFVFAEPRRALPEPKVVRAVEKALRSRRRLFIEYRAATRHGAVTRVHIEPLLVSVAEADPYVRAFCVERKGERTYSRIQSARVTAERASYPRKSSEPAPFDRAVKAWSGSSEVVKVRLDADVAWRAREYPLPGQTEHPNADGSVVLRAEVAGLVEVRSRILAWGAAAEVLQPRQLRDEVRAELAAALRKYDGPGPSKVRPREIENGRERQSHTG